MILKLNLAVIKVISFWPMRFLRIHAVSGTARPMKNWTKTVSAEIWAMLKKLTRKYLKDLDYNKRLESVQTVYTGARGARYIQSGLILFFGGYIR